MKLSFGILVPMIDFDFMRIFILEAIENKNGMPPFHDREQIFFMNKTGKSLNQKRKLFQPEYEIFLHKKVHISIKRLKNSNQRKVNIPTRKMKNIPI